MTPAASQRMGCGYGHWLVMLITTGVVSCQVGTDVLLRRDPPVMRKASVSDKNVLAKFYEPIRDEPTQTVLERAGLRTVKVFHHVGITLLEMMDDSEGDIWNAMAILEQSGLVEYAEPDRTWQALLAPNDPRFPELWGLRNSGQTGGTAGADISATQAWDITTGSDEMVVAVIDTETAPRPFQAIINLICPLTHSTGWTPTANGS